MTTTKRSDNRGSEIHRAEQKEANRHPVTNPPGVNARGMVSFTDGSLYERDQRGQLWLVEERRAK